MPSKRIQDVIDRFAAELLEVCEKEAAENIQHRVQDALGTVMTAIPATTVKRRKTTKGYSVLRPCPIEGCKETASPRHQMVCKKHDAELSREEILLARDKASKEGGIWYNLKPTRKHA